MQVSGILCHGVSRLVSQWGNSIKSPWQPVLIVYVTIVMGVVKMGNILPRVRLERTSRAFWASVLPLQHVGFPDVTTMPMPTCLWSSLHQRSVQTTTL